VPRRNSEKGEKCWTKRNRFAKVAWENSFHRCTRKRGPRRMATRKKRARLWEHFSVLKDPRIERNKEHKLIDIIAIAILAVICGADGWTHVEEFGNAKYEWLRGFLELPNGIPSHDTFGRVFSRLSAKAFQECFQSWVNEISILTQSEIVPIDGKTLRRSYDRGSGKKAIHMVSAWTSANRLLLGHVKTEEKSNEITAIPELLRLLELKGCIVTIDAMGCQKAIAEMIREKGADYVLALKGNQTNLHQETKAFFENATEKAFEAIPHDYYETSEHGHGRFEIRRYWSVGFLDAISERANWQDLKTIGMVESIREVDDNICSEVRYYISSLEQDAKKFARAVRKHWGIENSVHWVLDVAFQEDQCRIRKENGAENFSLLRRIALNLLRQETSTKLGVQAKRLRAGWDSRYLFKLLNQ
jgi:predicted transposase YbfD/YdcC